MDLITEFVEAIMIFSEKSENPVQRIKFLSPKDRLPFTIFWLDAEVHNGGLDQYLFNSSGDFKEEVIIDLIKLGAPKISELIEIAVETFKKKERNQISEETFDEEIDNLTDKFHEIYEEENLSILLEDFVYKNREAINKIKNYR